VIFLDPLYENVKEDIFGEIINATQASKAPKLPSLSGMKKDELIAECQRLGLEDTGTLVASYGRVLRKREKVLLKTYLKITSLHKVRMSLYDKITQIVDEELEDRVNAIINEYAETISKKHASP
jgi:hypothetical protein